jgi:TonB family protein
VRARITGLAVTAVVALVIAGAGAQTPAPATTATTDILSPIKEADQPIFAEYIKDVIVQIEQRWYELIPKKARGRNGKKGELMIQFVIHRDGKVSDMFLAHSSGDIALDRAAWNALVRAAPYKKFPKHVVENELKLRFKFLYNEQPDSAPAKSE